MICTLRNYKQGYMRTKIGLKLHQNNITPRRQVFPHLLAKANTEFTVTQHQGDEAKGNCVCVYFCCKGFLGACQRGFSIISLLIVLIVTSNHGIWTGVLHYTISFITNSSSSSSSSTLTVKINIYIQKILQSFMLMG